MVKAINLVWVLTTCYMRGTIAIELFSRTEFAVLTGFKDSFVFRAYSVDEYMANSITQRVYLHKWLLFVINKMSRSYVMETKWKAGTAKN